MTQSDLSRQVARATGESLKTITGRGFSLVELDRPEFDPEPDDTQPQVIDWDDVQDRRAGVFTSRRRSLARAA